MIPELLMHYLKYYLVPLLAMLLLSLVVVLVYNRIRYVLFLQRKRICLPIIATFLTDLTFSDLEKNELEAAVLDFKKKHPYHKEWFKRLVLSSIIDLSQNLKGDLVYNVRDIYVAFDLHKNSLKLIKSADWYQNCKGIFHFQTLHFKHGQKYIKPYISAKNEVLRSNAFIAHLYLTSEPLDFLVDYKYEISSVNEYKAVDVFYMKHAPIPKNIDRWLDAANDSIVILGIKVMVFYNYIGAAEKMITLLKHPNNRVLVEAIIAIRELYLLDAEEQLQLVFRDNNTIVQTEILKSLAVIGTEKTVSFISELVLDESIGDNVKLESLRTLKAVDHTNYDSNLPIVPKLNK